MSSDHSRTQRIRHEMILPQAPLERRNWLPTAVIIACFVITAVLIFKDSGVVPPHPMDQSFAGTADVRIGRSNGNWMFKYPTLEYSGGITSSLIAGIYKLLIPTSPDTLNWHIRILGAFMWLGSSLLLILRFVPTTATRILACLLIGTSGYQFIQPTSELFVGSLFALFLFSTSQRWPYAVSALFLAGFGLAKVEMVAAAIAGALIWWIWELRSGKAKAWRVLVWSGVWMAMLLLPGFIVSGNDPTSISRSFLCFKLSYVDLFNHHQFGGPLTFGKDLDMHTFADQVMARRFPGADTVFKIITKYPGLYAQYVAISSIHSLPAVIHSLKFMLIPMALVVLKGRDMTGLGLPLCLLGATAVLTLGPALMLTIFRIRYFVKLWPAFATLAVAGCDQLTWSRGSRISAILLWTCGLATIAIQLYYFQDMWINSHYR